MKVFDDINRFLTSFVVLADYKESIGNLRELRKNDDTLTLVFAIDYEVEVPIGAIPFDKIKELVGERVGILNAGNNTYRIRKISKSNKINKGDKNERNKSKQKKANR